MNTLSPNESNSQSREILKKAIAFMVTHQLSANPLNYTVCYEYLSGAEPSLIQTVNKALLDNTQITDQLMEEWFEAYLTNYKLATLRKSEADLKGIISNLSDSTKTADEKITKFNDALIQSEKELVEADLSLESIINDLLVSTKDTQDSMDRMKRQLKNSTEEIADLQMRLEQVSKEVSIDLLTGLTNRRGLLKAMDDTLASANESLSYPSLLVIDIDHFKNINDTYGHLLGDKVIKVIGDTIKGQVKGKDTVARYGGEEFCALLPDTELHNAVKVAENIRKAVENTIIKRSKDQQEICPVTVSIGVTRYQSKETVNDFFERADNALYRAKNDGRNCVVFLNRVASSK